MDFNPEKFKAVSFSKIGDQQNGRNLTPGKHEQGESPFDQLTEFVDTKVQHLELLMKSLNRNKLEKEVATLSENNIKEAFDPWDDKTKKEMWKSELENTLNELSSEQKAFYLQELRSLGEQVYTSITESCANLCYPDRRPNEFQAAFNSLPGIEQRAFYEYLQAKVLMPNEDLAGDVRNMAKHLLQSIGVEAKDRQKWAAELIFWMLPSDKQAAFVKNSPQNGQRKAYTEVKPSDKSVSSSSQILDNRIIKDVERQTAANNPSAESLQSATERRWKAKMETKSNTEIQEMISHLDQMGSELITIKGNCTKFIKKGTCKQFIDDMGFMSSDDRKKCQSIRDYLDQLSDALYSLRCCLRTELCWRNLAGKQGRQGGISSGYIANFAKHLAREQENRESIKDANNSISYYYYMIKEKEQIEKLLGDWHHILSSKEENLG